MTRIEVLDPISPDDAATPAEQDKSQRFGSELAAVIGGLTCEEHGIGAKTWHVGVEMRAPISVRDRFYVTVDVDAKRLNDIGPMSADIVNDLLMFIESGLAAGLPGSGGGSLSREITDLSEH